MSENRIVDEKIQLLIMEMLEHGAVMLCLNEDGNVGVWWGNDEDATEGNFLAADCNAEEALYAAALRVTSESRGRA